MNINTVNTKAEQLRNGYFKIDSGPELFLVIGSCRSVPYMNYLHEWNVENGMPYTLAFIDPFNFCFDLQDNRVDMQAVINSLETNEVMLEMLRIAKYCIHEYYNNFGMFSFDKSAEKNIYQFGFNPAVDICIPNFNDLFILFGDIVTFDPDARKWAIADWNVLGKLSDQTAEKLYEISQKNLSKFYDVCQKSDVPEMAIYFMANFKKVRFFWSYNHVSKAFTLAVFKLISDKYLHLDLSKGFNEDHVDMYANNYTKLTAEDVQAYGYQWPEEVISIKEKLF